MDEKQINQLETKIEKLVEGAFTNIFRRRVTAHDIAIKLTRSMEDHLRYERGADSRPLAPDEYTIRLHPRIHQQVQNARTSLAELLSEQLLELAIQSGYRLMDTPIIKILADNDVDEGDVLVAVRHTRAEDHSTQAMQPLSTPPENQTVRNPHLIINGERTVALTEPILNIGRSDENHVMIDDAYISRHHIQIRLRFGEYILFDVNSRGGTYVNNVRVREHRLQAGDVISIGNSQIIYVTDNHADSAHTTSILDPVDF